jgi:hypothetical protein
VIQQDKPDMALAVLGITFIGFCLLLVVMVVDSFGG